MEVFLTKKKKKNSGKRKTRFQQKFALGVRKEGKEKGRNKIGSHTL